MTFWACNKKIKLKDNYDNYKQIMEMEQSGESLDRVDGRAGQRPENSGIISRPLHENKINEILA